MKIVDITTTTKERKKRIWRFQDIWGGSSGETDYGTPKKQVRYKNPLLLHRQYRQRGVRSQGAGWDSHVPKWQRSCCPVLWLHLNTLFLLSLITDVFTGAENA